MLTTSAKRAFIDSNVLVYAYKKDESRHAAAIRVLDQLLRERSGVLSVQNLAEFSNVVAFKKAQPVDFEKIRLFVAHLREAFGVVPYTSNTVLRCLELSRDHKVHFFDALLAATMLEHGITTIYTENAEDFAKIPGVKAVNPFV